MRKVLSFSLFLMLGLVASQLLPGLLGPAYAPFKSASDTLLYICLGFIMINVGREFEIDKSRWRNYTADYFIAMATAALPWLLIVLYYVFVLLPADLWSSADAWKENLLLSRFAAPTSAGILFTCFTFNIRRQRHLSDAIKNAQHGLIELKQEKLSLTTRHGCCVSLLQPLKKESCACLWRLAGSKHAHRCCLTRDALNHGLNRAACFFVPAQPSLDHLGVVHNQKVARLQKTFDIGKDQIF